LALLHGHTVSSQPGKPRPPCPAPSPFTGQPVGTTDTAVDQQHELMLGVQPVQRGPHQVTVVEIPATGERNAFNKS